MNALILCQACKRHIRSAEKHCPFCGAEAVLPATAGSDRRPRGRAGGRAALFLAGAVTAGASAACEDSTNSVAVYGAPIDDGTEDDDDPSDAGAASDAGRAGKDTGTPLPVPVYGIPIDRDAGSSTPADASVRDAAIDPDAELGVPVYGIPIDPRDSGALACEAGVVADPARVPSPDGGRGDGGSTCASPQDAGVDSGRPMVAPVYGIPIDPGPRSKR